MTPFLDPNSTLTTRALARSGAARLVGVVLSLVAVGFIAGPMQAKADPVLEWNRLLLESIRMENTPAPLAARNLAILHGAILDAVSAGGEIPAPSTAQNDSASTCMRDAAAASAGNTAAAALFPSRRSVFTAAFDRALNDVPVGQAREAGVKLGAEAADRALVARADDGSATTVPYIPHIEPGQWRRTAPYHRPPELAHWRLVKPFVLTGAGQFLPPPPPALDSAAYADEVNQVRLLGRVDSSLRTPDQTEIARFWSNGVATVTPPGHWNQIAANVAKDRRTSLAENARLFAQLNVALADAGIATWECKYRYNRWRPVTAIERAGEDGNAATESDPHWSSLILNPAFPEYVSGHSAFSGAAAAVLASFFGSDEVPFTIGSDSLPGVTRSFKSFSQAAEESGISRVYGGIHFMSANREGLALGRKVADHVLRHFPAAERER